MSKFKEFDHIRLKDGREGAIVDIFGPEGQEVLLVDIGTSPADWETIQITRDDIDVDVEE